MPISLTKGWLSFFGFEFMGKSHWKKESKREYLNLLMYKGAMVVDSYKQAHWCNLGIMTVHHLQNIYFDTQEEELFQGIIGIDEEAKLYEMVVEI